MAQWMISIRSINKHKQLLVDKGNNESDVEVFKKAKDIYVKIKQKYPNYVVELISRKKAFAPKEKIKYDYVYCPYCRKDRKFQYNYTTGYSHCPVCNISDKEYYVKKYNNLWK
ncbi:MAG: hypothetical protein M0Q88_08660 [Bacilli bacterium]|nr:hypothetical protein [Bacilli bacterium]